MARRAFGGIGTAVLLAWAGVAWADSPAEPPPVGFAGRQYVDSAGCVFVRATVDGEVAWIARLTPDRTPLCGFQPTLAAGLGNATGSLPDIRPDAPPVILDTDTVARTSAEPAPETARAPAPATVPKARTRPLAAAAPRAPVRSSVIPPGYRAVWEDDRLNPRRGPRSAAGDAAMARLWSDSVPMQLIGK